MTATIDLGNRALQLLGTRSTVASLAEQSNEAVNLNLVLQPIINWCFGLVNWNFARETATLGLLKSAAPAGGPWSALQPSPPWLYEYAIPGDLVQAIYITNSSIAATGTAYLGEPQRFVVGSDTIGGTQQRVILSNASGAILVYTGMVADPTGWPAYFERMVVYALASSMCMALTGDKALDQEIGSRLRDHITIAIQINAIEGLQINDNTPEWIQALGMNFPFRRTAPAAQTPQGRGRNDNAN